MTIDRMQEEAVGTPIGPDVVEGAGHADRERSGTWQYEPSGPSLRPGRIRRSALDRRDRGAAARSRHIEAEAEGGWSGERLEEHVELLPLHAVERELIQVTCLVDRLPNDGVIGHNCCGRVFGCAVHRVGVETVRTFVAPRRCRHPGDSQRCVPGIGECKTTRGAVQYRRVRRITDDGEQGIHIPRHVEAEIAGRQLARRLEEDVYVLAGSACEHEFV